MAQCVTVFQFAIILHVYLVLKSAYVDSTEDTPCSFPQQSIACKVWNHTNMDCSWRELVCIPHLRNNASLELLDLSNNELTVLPRGAFSGLKLQTLNLSSSNISTVNADAFSGLNELQILDLSSNTISTINVDTFSVLCNLLSLDLRDNPLSSVNGTFTDLGNLKTLDLSVSKRSMMRHLSFTSDSPFKYLRSLKKLVPFGVI